MARDKVAPCCLWAGGPSGDGGQWRAVEFVALIPFRADLNRYPKLSLSPRAFHEVALTPYWILSRFVFADPGIACGVPPVCFPTLTLHWILCVSAVHSMSIPSPQPFRRDSRQSYGLQTNT
jgi:hypothetical protein